MGFLEKIATENIDNIGPLLISIKNTAKEIEQARATNETRQTSPDGLESSRRFLLSNLIGDEINNEQLLETIVKKLEAYKPNFDNLYVIASLKDLLTKDKETGTLPQDKIKKYLKDDNRLPEEIKAIEDCKSFLTQNKNQILQEELDNREKIPLKTAGNSKRHHLNKETNQEKTFSKEDEYFVSCQSRRVNVYL